MTQAKAPIADFPLLPKPVDVSPLTQAIVRDIVDRIIAEEEEDHEPTEEEETLLNALVIVFIELTAQLEWRSAMLSWMHDLSAWMDNSPNIIRKDGTHG
jgi:hypothetical protein